MKNTVFVHTNEKQIVGAIVAKHSLKRNSRRPDSFDVQIIEHKDHDFFRQFEGREFLRAKTKRVWTNDDLQSFTPLRFMPPELMGYQGRAVVIDPDVFATGDVAELLNIDMQGKAILAKPRPGHNGRDDYVATSVMLLDCAKLKHWNVRENFAEMFRFERDYDDWITLATEPAGTIGKLDDVWNDFDRLTAETRLLHNTKRRTQPWKTGLPIDYTNRIPFPFVAKLLGRNGIRLPLRYKRHPDPRQEQLFFALLKECHDLGLVTDELLTAQMASNHVRHDAVELMKQAPTVDEILTGLQHKQAA
jgi:hypothetical protein